MIDVLLDSEITKGFIDHLGGLGNITYKPEFPKPYFKIHLSDEHMIVGCQGNAYFRIVMNNSKSEKMIENIKNNFFDFVEEFEHQYNFLKPIN
ncbi:MAG: hypothetical protein HW421_3352 [Ignavibacteria bacterium]|nr:hypothetical protein [Ignavibacteria bacterium]